MSLNPDGFRLYHTRLVALVTQMNDLPKPILRGRAAALGTLTAILNRVNKQAEAWETRAMTPVDQAEVARNGPTLQWLREDPYVYADFEGVVFDVPEINERVAYLDAIDVLAEAQDQVVA